MRVVRGIPALVIVLAAALARAKAVPAPASQADLQALRSHFRDQWRSLQRRSTQPAVDSKLGARAGNLLYVPRGTTLKPREQGRLTRAGVQVRDLPKNPLGIREHGLLYLPGRYVTPGGRFVEQFGWDSYFIAHGMLDDGHVAVPREMTENLLYEVRNYGKVLNSNRTYAMGRSQPPFLTRMIFDVYERTGDKVWAVGTLDAVEKYWRYYSSGARRSKETGLSRYHDADRGAPAEVEAAGTTEVERIKAYFRAMPAKQAAPYYDRKTDKLTARFYKGDRAMRASGFDTTARFGPGGADAHEYNPVELNAFLYRMELDAAELAKMGGDARKQGVWLRRAARRQERVNQYLWDATKGMYFDHHVPTGTRSDYAFATTFAPLWAKMASQEQADAVAANLAIFERAGGLTMSAAKTGHQWDAPFGWGPMIQMAVEGLRNYGHDVEANRISVKYLSMVLKEFKRTGQVFEKYDTEHRDADVSRVLRYGYTTNEPGFGWTNGTFISLYKQLPRSERKKVLEMAR